MNYDTQYAFSHGLASAPQFQTLPQQHLQQRPQQFQPQQVFPQQHYGQIAPTSNVFFQFTGGGNPIFQQKDIHQMAALPTGGIQQASLGTQHGMVTSSFVKQGVPVRMEGNCVHLVGGTEGMLYQPQPQQSDLKIITANPDARMLQQHSQLDAGLGIPQNTAATLLGIDMMGGQPQTLLEQSSLDMGHPQHQQHQSIAITGQGGVLSYNKQPFSGPWLQQQHVSHSTGNLQQQQHTQSALPSFTHLWSQFQQHKNQTGISVQQHQHVSTIQQSQQFQNQNQLQPSQQQFAAASNFPTLAGMPMINMSHFKDQSQQQSPLPLIPNQMSCFSPCGPSSTPSPCPVDRFVSAADNSLAVQVKASSCQSTHTVIGDSPQHANPSLLTDSSSVPPKVTVILDSLPHCETFPPTTHFQGNSEAALKLGASSVIPCTDSPTMRNRHRGATSNGQLNLQQKKLGLCRPLKPISSTGSSMERSSSESSNFSSPPYAFTPPNSNDSLFSPAVQVFNADEHTLPASISESPASLCLSSSSFSSVMSPSSLSLSPIQNSASAKPKTSGKGLATNLDGGTQITSNCTTASVATVLALSSPSTTTVITAMASSHQLVTTTTTTTSVTLASHCLMEGTTTTVRSCSTASDRSIIPHCKSGKTSVPSNSGKAKEMSEAVNSKPSCVGKKVKVPFNWHRKLENGAVLYLSPTGTVLQSHDQICQYLLSDSTCKCGLECPIQVKEFFSFDPSVESQPWTLEADDSQTTKSAGADKGGKQKQEDLRKLCNHRREILALAALHNSQSHMRTENSPQKGKKRDRKKSVSGSENLILSPLKRLKTSITNAVNRHAVSTGKRKISKLAPGTLSGSPSSLNAEMELASAMSSVPGLVQQNLSLDGCSSLSPMGITEDTFSGFIDGQEEWKDHDLFDNTIKQTESGAPQLNNEEPSPVRVMEINLSDQAKNWSSDQDQHISDSEDYSQIRHTDVALSQKHSIQKAFSNPPQSLTAAHLNSSLPCWNPESAYAGDFPKHSTPINKSDSKVWPEPVTHSGQSQASVEVLKTKTKKPRAKKQKQKQLFISSIPAPKQATSKNTVEDDLLLPPDAVSFLENPTVFVAQQTVMINNSMASCNIAYSSPVPIDPSPSPTDVMSKLEKKQETTVYPSGQPKGMVIKEEEERKTGTDTDSNRSFSDTTENNDSAYLSQTGSDQERSDTIDGSDSCLEAHKVLDVYDFNCSEEREFKADPGIVHVDMKASDSNNTKSQNSTEGVKTSLAEIKLSSPKITSAGGKEPSVQEKPSVPKQKPKHKSSPSCAKRTSQQKNGMEEALKGDDIGSLNKDLSNLLASDNWNIPAVQQVLAQYSGGDPGQLNAAIQQVLSQASTAGVDFPASNLLTAAAKAQVKGGNKKSTPNGVLASRGVTALPCLKSDRLPISPVGGVAGRTESKSTHSKQQQQQQGQESVVSQSTGQVARNVVQLPQGKSGLAMNMALPGTKNELMQKGSGANFASDANLLKAIEPEIKVAATVNPLMAAHNVHASARLQPVDVGAKLGLPIPPVIPTSPAQVSSVNKPVILNGFGSPRMIVNSQIPPASVVTTSVSKTMTIGLNQAVFGAVSTPAPPLTQQHILATAQQQQQHNAGNACIINAPSHHIGKPAGNAGQPSGLLATANTHQLMTPSGHQASQLAAAQQANTQMINALSVQGLNPSQQLLLQQMSPCNPVSQLSPAMAAQILTQNQQQQQLPQMSPSFLPGGHPQVQKLPQTSVLANQTSIFASVPLPSFSATPATSNCSGLFTQANTCIPPSQPQQQQRSSDGGLPAIINASVDATDQLAHSLSQVKDVAVGVSLAGTPMFAATSQPLFVIPQANANPVVQVIGSTQSLATATELNVQQQNNSFAAHLFGQQQSQQTPAFDTSQLQNLLSTGFSPLALQQTINTVNLSGVQQHQQLQMLQLQQLMLQQLQNQQNLQGISLPGQQTAAQAIVNAVMPTPNLQLGSMMDMNAIHSSLSPVAASANPHQNLLGNPLSQPQLHITSSIGAQPVVQGSTAAPVGVLQHASVQKVPQTLVKTMSSGSAHAQVPAMTTATGKHSTSTVVGSHHENFHQKQTHVGGPAGQVPTLPTSSNKPQASSVSPTSPASSLSKSSSSSKSSKSKSKSKKSEAKKVSNPESERNEEDIAATVQQILAQAVQQQRELQLAAKNQPPPPPKSKSKKSQSRSKTNANHSAGMSAAPPVISKEHDLGKLPSIMSDDVVIHKPEQVLLSNPKCGTSGSVVASGAASSNNSSVNSQPDPSRSSQVVQPLPLPSKLQPQQSSFLTPVGSVASPPNASLAAARTAQSSQPVGAEPTVTPQVPQASQHIMFQGCPMPQAFKKNGAVTEDNVQANVNAAGGTTKALVQNRNLTVNSNSKHGTGGYNKKSSLSLKDHLSSIISKDKDSSKKRVNGGPSATFPSRTKEAEDLNKTAQLTGLAHQKLEQAAPKVLRKSVK
ncbi:hypothetical protein EGW08_003791 [Elysia chlorotica]|uniref:MBD domain-containing protein n=1 Tax=Elysia chlorotica TaxID=188477 RepID=A0A3S1BTS0_ELYCH|nr:hypothetical protein EGW08_003791 [Elysia chlorotica]